METTDRKLTNAINGFLDVSSEELKVFKLIDIKFSTCVDERKLYYSALIIFSTEEAN
jgi:hypothetical protein